MAIGCLPSLMCHDILVRFFSKSHSGCGAARLARFVRDEEVGGSNPLTPTQTNIPQWIPGRLARSVQDEKVGSLRRKSLSQICGVRRGEARCDSRSHTFHLLPLILNQLHWDQAGILERAFLDSGATDHGDQGHSSYGSSRVEKDIPEVKNAGGQENLYHFTQATDKGCQESSFPGGMPYR